ncbi:TRAP transporter substrate-binding protein [Shinella sedimenti]|uniref:TRAP transporter substrate-binding protein n=1 Tax=Shinella sedimenti TaxID=2919913 RepID=A0ABT0CNK1_9HYPH|nr:TRAP transporter substrate-binding protein [Shinella sedimenti]MCJ8150162.1 TRAP transporter substrate-binding protein [Shinella sedimenti]
MNMKRLAATAVIFAATGFAPALAQTVVNIGHGVQTGHPTHIGLLKLAELVKERTDGKVVIQVYPDRQLGEEREMVEGLQLGTVEMTVVSTGPVVNFVPEAGVLDLPFLFENSAHAYKVFDGDIGKELLAKFDGADMVGLAIWENGWRHLSAKKAVEKPSDLSGMKLRTMQNPVHMRAFEALGASPIPMAWGEVFTSLGQGVIDGQENPITIFYTNSLWEVQSHIALTGHVYGPHMVLASKSVWESWPEEVRTAVLEALPDATAFQRSESLRLETEQAELLRERGVNIAKIDTTPFREKAQAVYSSFDFDPALLERIRAVAAE